MGFIPASPLALMLGKHSNWVSGLAFSPNNQQLASADTVGFVILWDMRTGQPVLPAWKADDYGVHSLDFSPDGSMLATAGVDDHIHIWDADPTSETFGEALRSPLDGHSRDVTVVAFHPDGKFLVSGDDNGSIMFWDMDRESANFGEQQARLGAKKSAGIRDLIIDPSGEILIAFSSVDVTIWDISKTPPDQIQGFVYSDDVRWNFPVYNLIALDPDVSILILAIYKSLQIFDLDLRSATFSELLEKPIEEYSGRIFSINVSPDYLTLASGDEYGRLQLWDMTSWLPLGPPLIAHYTDIYNLSFNRSGSILVSGDNGGNVVLWDTVLEHWIVQACRRANRNLTQQEWQHYFGDEPYQATCPDLPVNTGQ
jgi:WD40 repeat protein